MFVNIYGIILVTIIILKSCYLGILWTWQCLLLSLPVLSYGGFESTGWNEKLAMPQIIHLGRLMQLLTFQGKKIDENRGKPANSMGINEIFSWELG